MTRLFFAVAVLAATLAGSAQAQTDSILNASYDISRELFAKINEAFIPKYKETSGQDISIKQSHGGSSAQARAVLEGLDADVVTFNQVVDIEALVKGGLVSDDWRKDFANNSSPYYSFPAFLVREGNPKGIKDWSDLVRDDVEVIFPNPKTSGNARYTYLAAVAYANAAFQNDQTKVTEFVSKLFANVPVFDTGGRAATTTFVQREIGDVLITFEAETLGIAREYGDDKFDVVVPSMSLLAEFPVAIVDTVVDRRGSRDLAKSYLEFLYTPEGQRIIAEHGNRPNDPTIAAEFKDKFPEVKLVTVDEVFGGWEKVRAEHLVSGALLDQIYGARR